MIEVKHVTKCYGKFKAVDDVSSVSYTHLLSTCFYDYFCGVHSDLVFTKLRFYIAHGCGFRRIYVSAAGNMVISYFCTTWL